MDNLSQQVDEIEALVAIYGDEWKTEDEENRAYSIDINEGGSYVKLYLKLPKDYPSGSPPMYEISAPHLGQAEKVRLGNLLDEVYLDNIGENVIFQWIEKIREKLQSGVKVSQEAEPKPDLDIENIETVSRKRDSRPEDDHDCPTIFHGEVIVDRKSSFQGHAAIVVTTDQVKQVLRKLYENKKIEHATHNIYAYRIYREDTKAFIQDCEDDGESQAGGRMLHLLQIIDAQNVVVVVSRWYGGIHLGPDRFRHINNAARQVLEAANMIPESKEKKK